MIRVSGKTGRRHRPGQQTTCEVIGCDRVATFCVRVYDRSTERRSKTRLICAKHYLETLYTARRGGNRGAIGEGKDEW